MQKMFLEIAPVLDIFSWVVVIGGIVWTISGLKRAEEKNPNKPAIFLLMMLLISVLGLYFMILGVRVSCVLGVIVFNNPDMPDMIAKVYEKYIVLPQDVPQYEYRVYFNFEKFRFEDNIKWRSGIR